MVEEHHRESLDFLEKFESRNLNSDIPAGKSSKGSEKCIILNSLSLIKGMYLKKVTIIYNGESLNAFSLRLGTRQ